MQMTINSMRLMGVTLLVIANLFVAYFSERASLPFFILTLGIFDALLLAGLFLNKKKGSVTLFLHQTYAFTAFICLLYTLNPEGSVIGFRFFGGVAFTLIYLLVLVTLYVRKKNGAYDD